MEGGQRAENESTCLMLLPDDITVGNVKPVLFRRDVDESGDRGPNEIAADLLGIHGDRVRCFSVRGFDQKLGYALHLFIDLQGVEHQLPHNTNATQFWLISNLPEEPPHVSPASINGPALLTGEDFHTGDYVDLTMEDWEKIKRICKAVQPNAMFHPPQPME
uniref:Uncharacterized protein n=1 Tax=Dunaliella tertiolecta TaxID=3047 RepID=A0A7S3VP18_DUNTE|mmetsp:Transcript_27285/g.73742  ORF Transcript_27285/g.73742 Transcript_27285/m.73742 type:complete len:162 (+) Transcript_27285:80-565(+)|eukprot:CAMPEP_0202385272 /NCGR_PEP_ID=MMETSP1127-20130417/59811_1 /ASSEMBLY_ACC=CAM_ASM_000462 /TAXON_ID=3047 /ORGANISM="Dunaliella tertiolecta, Strain CCMP1320" /LENGTH=161 /DNA_ID=CAMNT_0048985377 /DNA_START=40 /DNA_END=525 /DNA_ORIENTATION=-